VGENTVNAQLTITERFVDEEIRNSEYSDYMLTEPRLTPLRLRCSWLPNVWEQLETLASLPDGWDSYGAPSPDLNKVKAAWELLNCLCDATDMPRPHVNPTRSGGVQFEWEVGNRYFELEVVGERAATYLYCDDAAKVEETGDLFEGESLESVLGYISKVGTHQ